MNDHDIVERYILSGRAFSTNYNQTIGGSAQGWYGISIFNPVVSAINVLIYSILVYTNNTTGTNFVFSESIDPALGNILTPQNTQLGGSASALTSTVSSNTSPVSFPSSPQIFGTTSMCEMLTNNSKLLLPKNQATGIGVYAFASNSDNYGITIRWIEF